MATPTKLAKTARAAISRAGHCDLGVRNRRRLPKDFKCANGPCFDGEATAPRHGAADRPGAHDDALPPGRRRGAPAPCRPSATVRGARTSDPDAPPPPPPSPLHALLLPAVPR